MFLILVGGLVKLFSTLLGGSLSFLGPCTFGFVLAVAPWFWAAFYLGFVGSGVFTPRYTLKAIFRVSLRRNTTKPPSKVLRTGGSLRIISVVLRLGFLVWEER